MQAVSRSYTDAVAEAAQRLVLPHAVRIDREDRYPADVFGALAEVMSMAPSVPVAYGGGGQDLVECSRALSLLSAASPSVALSWGAHAFLCAHNLYLLGSEAQRRRYLGDLASYRKVGAFAITEPGAGSDATSISTRAVRHGDDWLLSGEKTFITNGSIADVVLLFAQTDVGVSLFIVESGFTGFGVGKNIAKLGFRGSPTSWLVLDGCRVPHANLIGEPGGGARLMMRCLDVERTLLSGVALGMLQCLETLLIESAAPTPSQSYLELLAETVAALESMRILGDDAARRLQRGERVTVPASVIKLSGADQIGRLAGRAVEILGWPAVRAGATAERLMRDSKLISIGAGTSEVQKLILAREALKSRPA